jgi:hypothetical protein
MLCDVALSDVPEVERTPVFDPKSSTIIFMDLRKYPCEQRKGGSVRKVYYIDRTLLVKVYVLTCKQVRAKHPCRECYRETHHKCQNSVHVHVLRTREGCKKIQT